MLKLTINESRTSEAAGNIGASLGFIIWGFIITLLNNSPRIQYSEGWLIVSYCLIFIGLSCLIGTSLYCIDKNNKPLI